MDSKVGSRSMGVVGSCWRYPVKSMQGTPVDSLEVGASGVVGDRSYALLDRSSGKVLSAKRVGSLLQVAATDTTIRLPDGTELEIGSEGVDEALSAWTGRDVSLLRAEGTSGLGYEMTFDPPDDSAEYYEIPMPAGTFVDLAHLHLVSTATLEGCRKARPDLDWDVRRFRPNLLIDVDGPPFIEDDWVGRQLRFAGGMVCSVQQATVRCAMPLRAQPALADLGVTRGSTSVGGPELTRSGAELEREPGLFHAMNELHEAAPNHLGVYAQVVVPGTVAVGEAVELIEVDPAGAQPSSAV